MNRLSVFALLLQPAAVEFVLPALLHLHQSLRAVTLVTDPAWVSSEDLARIPGCSVLDRSDTASAIPDRIAAAQPDVLVLSTSRSPTEIAALAAARMLGIRTVQILDAPYDHAARVHDSSPPGVAADGIAVMSESDRLALLAGDIASDRPVVVGHPGWERIRPAPPAEPTAMVFVSQPIAADGYGRFGYCEKSSWQTVLDARKARPDLFASLVWARHPRQPALTTTPTGCDSTTATTDEALRHCGTVLGIFSSVMVSAFLMGRRVVSVQPGTPPDDFCGLSRGGLIPRCATADELVSSLEALICDRAESLRRELTGSAARLATLIGRGVLE
jgi:hypothetical protein